jgi:mannosyltransferase
MIRSATLKQTRNKPQQVLLPLACILLLAGVLRCWNISQSFWWDEIWSTMPYATSSSVWHTISSLGYYFNNHLFYSLLARFSIMLLGKNEIAARLPAVIMGLGGVAALFFTGKKFLGAGSGIVGALLFAVSAFHIDHSTEARGYAGLALFSLLSSYYFLDNLNANRFKAWLLFSVFTILGFYTHPFMIAVCFAQFFCIVLFFAAGKAGLQRLAVTFAVLRSMMVSLLCAAIITLILYAPVLPAFMHNMGKVRVVAVTRGPFLVSLFSSWCPGIDSPAGAIVYGVLLCLGIFVCGKKAPQMTVYSIVLTVIPLGLYLLLNPMFVFQRYFIFALPFILLTIGSAVAALAERLSVINRIGAVSLCLFILFYLQWPALHRMLTQDRQDYRDAIQFVEHNSTDANADLVFSIGYAGEHFRYYAHSATVALPESLTALKQLSAGKKHIWCLITAWLPAIRPAYEDRVLYAEKPEQAEIFNYIKQHFRLKKVYQSRYPVEIYYAEQ